MSNVCEFRVQPGLQSLRVYGLDNSLIAECIPTFPPTIDWPAIEAICAKPTSWIKADTMHLRAICELLIFARDSKEPTK